MPVRWKPSVTSTPVEPFDDADDEPSRGWVHPDDRLWRHPSEMASAAEPIVSAPVSPSGLKMPNVFAVAGLAGLIGALFTAGLIAAIGGFNARLQPVRSIERVASPTMVRTATSTPTADGVVTVAQRLRPAIVEINVTGDQGQSSGSGVAFREDGHILTNHHVVKGATKIEVITSEGRTIPARLVGSDAETDMAVVKVDQAMPAATLGTVSGLQVGQQAIAIGSPLGLAGGPSVSVGVVSALGRRFDSNDGTPLLDMIQTDAPISPGSSGGALVDSNGNVIGITTAIVVTEGIGAEGLGFATPIDVARDVAEQLITTGRVVHVWLGVRGEDLSAGMAKSLGITSGAIVREVVKGSPAESAGIKAQDVIMSVNGHAVTGIGDVIVSVRQRKIGEKVKVTVWRGGAIKTVSVVLSERNS
jgi:S1-C subfamily serine protease